jgi:hypothetical protein
MPPHGPVALEAEGFIQGLFAQALSTLNANIPEWELMRDAMASALISGLL